MAHWSALFVGRPYVEGEFDCGELARAVQREVFCREIRIPSERMYSGLKGAAMLRAMAAQIEAELPDCCEPTTAPQEGDGVLLHARGYHQHVGIYCVVDAEPCVLHATDASKQVVRTRLRELAIRGLKVEGFYRWK